MNAADRRTIALDYAGGAALSPVLRDELTLYHSDQWREALCDMYGYRPFPRSIERNGVVVGLANLVVTFPLGRTVVRSPPASMYGHLVADTEDDERELIALLEEEASRSRAALSIGTLRPATHTLHRIDTRIDARVGLGTEQSCWETLSGSARRNVRRSRREAVRIAAGDCADLDEFMQVLASTRRRLGLPLPPRSWLKRLLSSGLAGLVVARSRGRLCAAILFVSDEHSVHYSIPAYSDEGARLRSLDGCVWELMRMAVAERRSWLCLGGSGPEDEGLRRFKRKWGAEERPIHTLANRPRSARLGTRAVRHRLTSMLPTPALELMGHACLRYLV